MSIYGKPFLTGVKTGTASGPIVSVNDALAAPLRSLLVNIDPVQEGSGDPSPDNVRPISGWSAVNVWRTGKNLLDPSLKTEDVSVRKRWAWDNGIMLKGGATYTFSAYRQTGITLYFSFFDGTAALSGTNSVTYTPQKDTLVKLQAYRAEGINDDVVFQLELGSTATAYEPYQGDTYTIQLGQTVYGATLDVTNGVLTVDRAMVDLTVGMSGGTAGSGYVFYKEISNPKIVPNSQIAPIISEAYIPIRFNGVSGNDNTIAVRDNGVVYVNTGSADIQPIGKAVYELATPITIPLTPQEISTLQGQINNVWADTGDVTVEYLKRSLTYIS